MESMSPIESFESPIDIKEYLYLFWSWAWLIALAGLVIGLAAYAISVATPPTYEATTRLLVSAPSNISGVDPTALVTTQTMTATYAQMLLDRPVLQGVIDQLKLQTTPEELQKHISVSIVTDTQLLTITVQDSNPVQATNIANALDTVFAARISELQSQRYAASRDGLQKQISDMEQQITNTSAQIASNNNATVVQQLQAQLTQYRSIYATLVTSYEQVRLAEEQTSTNVVISAPATVPTTPISPKTGRNTAIGFVVGLLLAAGVVFAVDALDDSIKNPDEIRTKFNVPILGMIAWHSSPGGRPITLNEPRSPVAEAFRSLRTNITFAGVDTPLRRILITSPTPQEGKTTVSTNLAVVLAQGEKKVVLIDADLRRPQVHMRFGLLNRSGLTNLFSSSLDNLPDVMHWSGLVRLGILTSGPMPPNPAELLTSQRMKRILDQLNRENDLILIDTPPMLTVTDAAALAPAMDGVVIVVRPGATKMSAFRQALDQLRGVGARILGVVLNEVNVGSRKYGYYYNRYYSKYGYYSEKSTEIKTQPRKPIAEPEPADIMEDRQPDEEELENFLPPLRLKP